MSRSMVGDSVLPGIVDRDVCVGCGFCAAALPDVLRMRRTAAGTFVPERTEAPATDGWGPLSLRVCPFADGLNEDDIAATRFGRQPGVSHTSETGYFLRCFTGHVADAQDRLRSSSGGFISWTVRALLTSGAADAAVCVVPSTRDDRHFDFALIEDPNDLVRVKKSRYYPVEVSRVVPEIKRRKLRTVFVGVPCFVKAMHRTIAEDPELRPLVVATIGLFCGHLKSQNYFRYLARACGMDEAHVVTGDFRKKVEGVPAYKYVFEATARQNGHEVSRQVFADEVFAASWRYNGLMLNACHYCDDVMAETADAAFGDAWLPEFHGDWRGTNIAVIRRQDILDLFIAAQAQGDVLIQDVSAAQVSRSQRGGLMQRRQGLQYRIAVDEKRGRWHPPKRVQPKLDVGAPSFRLVQRLRMISTRMSHAAVADQLAQPGNGLGIVKRRMAWVVFALYLLAMWHSICRRLGRNIYHTEGAETGPAKPFTPTPAREPSRQRAG